MSKASQSLRRSQDTTAVVPVPENGSTTICFPSSASRMSPTSFTLYAGVRRNHPCRPAWRLCLNVRSARCFMRRATASKRIEPVTELAKPVERKHEPASVLGIQDPVDLASQRRIDLFVVDRSLSVCRPYRTQNVRVRGDVAVGGIDRDLTPPIESGLELPLSPVNRPDEKA